MRKSLAEDGLRYCKRGHPRTPENVNPSHHCRACKAAQAAAHYDREKATAKKAAYRAAHREESLAYETAYRAARYWALTGVERNLELLKARRWRALRRMAERHSREGAS